MTWKDMREKYPDLFKGCFDYSPAPGWDPIVEGLVARMSEDHTCRIFQIKEKFGELRVYYSSSDPVIDSFVENAVKSCRSICEDCGLGTATSGGKGWIRTLCPECRKVRDQQGQG